MAGEPGQLSATTGRYEDDLRKVDGRWKLRARKGIVDVPGM